MGEKDGVLVEVVEIRDGRQVGLAKTTLDRLENRIESVKHAIHTGARSVMHSVDQLPSSERWQLEEITTSFALSFTGETDVLLSKASAGAAMEVTLVYRRLL